MRKGNALLPGLRAERGSSRSWPLPVWWAGLAGAWVVIVVLVVVADVWGWGAGLSAVLVLTVLVLALPSVRGRLAGSQTVTGQALRESQLRAQAVLAAAVEGVLVVDDTGRIESANPAAEAMFGYPPGGLAGVDVSVLVPEELRQAHQGLVAGFDPHTSGAYLMDRGRQLQGRRRDGTTIPVEVTLTELHLPGQRRVVSTTVRDISERRQYEERLRHLSLHDPLTRLGNRTLLEDRLRQALARQKRHGSLIAVLMCDLDHFKAINDSLGHGVGDQLLVHIAAQLRETVRPQDTVVRFGGDEFVIVCDDLPGQDAARQLARRVLAAIDQPVRIAGHDLNPSLSIGLVLTAGHHDGAMPAPEALIGDADLALLAAKDAGRARVVTFQPAMRDHVLGRLQLAHDLRSGLSRGEFEVFYQPMINLTDRQITGAEALIRWRHPRRGLLLPDVFLPVAAATDLVVNLDRFVITTACHDLSHAATALGPVW